MKLYLLACLIAIASSAALESATKTTKKAPPKVDPVPLSTANTASDSRTVEPRTVTTTRTTTPLQSPTSRPPPLPSILLVTLFLLSALSSSPFLLVLPSPTHHRYPSP